MSKWSSPGGFLCYYYLSRIKETGCACVVDMKAIKTFRVATNAKGEFTMVKFVEFVATGTKPEMRLYAKLGNGSLIHVRDYDSLYGSDYQFYRSKEGIFNEIYCHDGVSCIIHDDKLFEFTQDMYGVNHETEITLPMLLADAN